MRNNPLVDESRSNSPLLPEMCQRIHYTALRNATRMRSPTPWPAHLDRDYLIAQQQRYGAEICLIHPTDLARVFAGVTLPVYQTIEALYCSRLERSIAMVWRIMAAMAEQATVPPISEEAVWAIGMYVHESRARQTMVTITRLETTWQIVPFYAASLPPMVCVIDQHAKKVLAFRSDHESTKETGMLQTLYDACAAQRRPSQDDTTGVTWTLPTHLTSSMTLHPDILQFCAQGGIQVEAETLESPLLQTLREVYATWPAVAMSSKRLVQVFDNYLSKVHGYGPVIAQVACDRQFAHRTGYNRDPAWQFPALRRLLPAQSGIVADDGTVACDGLHFEDALLPLWIGQSVTVRRSRANAAAAFISINEDWLCLAMARELRRADGTYRTHLPGRC